MDYKNTVSQRGTAISSLAPLFTLVYARPSPKAKAIPAIVCTREPGDKEAEFGVVFTPKVTRDHHFQYVPGTSIEFCQIDTFYLERFERAGREILPPRKYQSIVFTARS